MDASNRGYLHDAGLQPVLVHLSKNAQGSFSFNPVSINFLVEVVKTTFAVGMLILYVRFSTHPSLYMPVPASCILYCCTDK